MKLSSSAFEDGDMIPVRYTCDGADMSPPLQWEGAPDETMSFVLIVHDEDAPMGDWDHWVVYNIPSTATEITEDRLPRGSQVGVNSWGHDVYNGPCPPDAMHRYQFELYALDTELTLPRLADRDQVEAAMRGHVILHTQLMGKYERIPGA